MIASLSLILLCQLIGEVFVRGLGMPMPGAGDRSFAFTAVAIGGL
jgi:hypothetical protein